MADNINSVKYYSTKAPESKSPKPTYNSSYTYGVPHSDSNIPIVIFAGSENETKKVKCFEVAELAGDTSCFINISKLMLHFVEYHFV